MASCGIYNHLVAFSNQPTSKPPIFIAPNPVNHIAVSPRSRLSYSLSTVVPKASSTALEAIIYQETDEIPVPKVIIDQDSDLDATVVEITFGDRLGALLDTV
ncbi:putative ACT domain-containing protein ACR1-12 [Helianthus annuus]|nr:putative ACT domain-containing protein ACR1-12 [Helianthus annuus]KAJ0709382.1 putative ACT domain-containing protein ACR1-12 [Helianthus annuus]KAJ0713258.1 putative ACT domain-containing protein ACR1-12 [Helianthus annuus]KAJ0803865.1 putative ACT domain-containing protein ACR1-12 [Helianthus annuus]